MNAAATAGSAARMRLASWSERARVRRRARAARARSRRMPCALQPRTQGPAPKRAASPASSAASVSPALRRPRIAPLRPRELGHRHEAVVGGEHRDVVVAAHLAVEVAQERGEQVVELQHVVVREARLHAPGVVHVVVAGEAHGEDVGGLVRAERLARDRGAREVERERVAEGAGKQAPVEERARRRPGPRPSSSAACRRGAEPRLAVGHRARVGHRPAAAAPTSRRSSDRRAGRR